MVSPTTLTKYLTDCLLRHVITGGPAPLTTTDKLAVVRLRPTTRSHWDSSTRSKQFMVLMSCWGKGAGGKATPRPQRVCNQSPQCESLMCIT